MERFLKIKKRSSYHYFWFVLFISCQPIDYENIPYYQNYFPLEIGNEKEFLITRITHNSFGKDTNSYFLKELITEKFNDLEGDTVYRLERYSKADSNTSYTIKDVWTTKLNYNNALLTEENEIFTKLIFPLNINVFWNGNAFNNRPYQEYTLESIHAPYQNQLFSFDSSLTVIQSYKLNLLEYESAKEVYVSSVGLVYKEDIEVKFVPGNQNIIEEGYEYYQELISN